jgi:hypothetical protein
MPLLGYFVKFRDGVKEPPVAQLYFQHTEEGRAQAAEFIRKHDERGFSLYSCIGRLARSPRNKGNVAELDQVVVDIDLRNIVEDREQVIARLRELPLPPEVRDSGRGIHAVWRLREPLVDEPGMAEAELIMRRLVALLAGDPKPTHRAALLRHLGTHNSRDGGWVECRVLIEGSKVDISEFDDLFDLYNGAKVLHSKVTQEEQENSSFTSDGKRYPIDLEAMRYQGNPGMHDTFVGYVGSRLSFGDTLDDIIERVVEVAARNCSKDPNRAKWRNELCSVATWYLQKSPEFIDTALNAEHAQKWTAALDADRRPTVVWKVNHGIEVRAYGDKNGGGTEHAQEQQESAQQNTRQDAPEEPKVRFKFVHYTDLHLDLTEQPYLVDELIPRRGLVTIWGKPKCYKSFLTFDMMWHVVKGLTWHDRAVRQGVVAFCAFEGNHGYGARVEALLKHYAVDRSDRGPLYAISGNANLIADHRLMIREFQGEMRKHGQEKLSAIVLDTLNKSLYGSESKDTDMANYIRAAEALRDAFDCVVIIIHHCGHDETRPRGHSSLLGAVDVQLAVTRDEIDDKLMTMKVEHMRDGPEGATIRGRAKVIEVGIDCLGKARTSMVIEPLDHSDGPSGGPVKRRTWPKALIVFRDALTEAILSHGQDFQIEGGPRVKAADAEHVRAAFYKTYLAEGADPQQARRKAFHRCLQVAQSRHLVGVRVSDDRQLIWSATNYG